MNEEVKQIALNQKAYYFLVECAEYYCNKKDYNKSLFFCRNAADFATFNYCGFYADGRLETLLAKIANPEKPEEHSPKTAGTRLRVLHYATHIYTVGGHTRLIENWIRNDTGHHHDLVLANDNEPVPDFITAALIQAQGQLIRLSGRDLLEQARNLSILKERYDVIILHHHPNDLLPVLAFSVGGGAPVAVMNHGDHRYWLGAGICDVLLEIRDNMISPDQRHRQVDEFCLLPLPIAAKSITDKQYAISRQSLGVKDKEVMLLSIGSSYKYQPIDDRNFFSDVQSILDSNEQARLFIVGIPPDDDIAHKYAHPRFTFVAPTSELDVFRNACDIYVEGYPFSSFMAYLEVARLGKPVQRMYSPTLLNQYGLWDYPNPTQYPIDLLQWQRELQQLIREPIIREARSQAEKHNLVLHNVSSWQQYVAGFYKLLPQLKHSFKKLKKVDIFLDKNDIYLYKMQPSFNTDIIPCYFYKLPFNLKYKLLFGEIKNLISTSEINFKDAMWILFRSARLIDDKKNQ